MPSPFLVRSLVQWLAAQTVSRAQQMVVDEVKSRVQSGDLGSYEGVLFKDSFKSSSNSRVTAGGVDLGVVVATKQEIVGLLDKMGSPRTTKGASFKYYVGTWKGRRVAIVVTGQGLTPAREGTAALIQAFSPMRVASVGFAAPLVSSLPSRALFIPDRLCRKNGSSLDLSPPALTVEPQSAPEKPAPEKTPAASETKSDPVTNVVMDAITETITGAKPANSKGVGDLSDAMLSSVKKTILKSLDPTASESGSGSVKEESAKAEPVKAESESAAAEASDAHAPSEPSETTPSEETSAASTAPSEPVEPSPSDESAEAEASSPAPVAPASEPVDARPTTVRVEELLNAYRTGTLLSLNADVPASDEKHGASAYDHSTWGVADICGQEGVPFLPLRVIFDGPAQDVSREAAQVAASNQSFARSLGAFLGATMKKPSAALDVYKIKEQQLQAADKLADAICRILTAVPASAPR